MKKIYSRIAYLLLTIPLAFFLVFTVGEVASGDLSGLSHILQAVPLILLIYLCYKKPFFGGIVLIVASISLGLLYALKVPFEPTTIAIVESFLFIPPLIAGILFLLSKQ